MFGEMREMGVRGLLIYCATITAAIRSAPSAVHSLASVAVPSSLDERRQAVNGGSAGRAKEAAYRGRNGPQLSYGKSSDCHRGHGPPSP
jgi:hypothetical protein